MEHLENSRRTIYIPDHGAIHRNMLLIKVHTFKTDEENPLIYNVHENTNLQYFTKVLATSLKMNKNLIQLNDEDNKEIPEIYTPFKDLYPNDRIIQLIFHKKISKKEEISQRTKITLDKTCDIHSKFTIFYCFTCNKSICYGCLCENQEHFGHEYTDKMDIVRDSKFLVEEMFQQISNEINNMEILNGKKYEIFLKNSEENFDDCIELMQKMKKNVKNFVDNYQKAEEISLENTKKNLVHVKDVCSDSLHTLLHRLGRNQITNDDKTFLDFYSRYVEIKDEENKLENFKKTFDKLESNFKNIANHLKVFYEDFDILIKDNDRNFENKIKSYNRNIDKIEIIEDKELEEIKKKILKNFDKNKNGHNHFSVFDNNNINRFCGNAAENNILSRFKLDSTSYLNSSNQNFIYPDLYKNNRDDKILRKTQINKNDESKNDIITGYNIKDKSKNIFHKLDSKNQELNNLNFTSKDKNNLNDSRNSICSTFSKAEVISEAIFNMPPSQVDINNFFNVLQTDKKKINSSFEINTESNFEKSPINKKQIIEEAKRNSIIEKFADEEELNKPSQEIFKSFDGFKNKNPNYNNNVNDLNNTEFYNPFNDSKKSVDKNEINNENIHSQLFPSRANSRENNNIDIINTNKILPDIEIYNDISAIGNLNNQSVISHINQYFNEENKNIPNEELDNSRFKIKIPLNSKHGSSIKKMDIVENDDKDNLKNVKINSAEYIKDKSENNNNINNQNKQSENSYFNNLSSLDLNSNNNENKNKFINTNYKELELIENSFLKNFQKNNKNLNLEENKKYDFQTNNILYNSLKEKENTPTKKIQENKMEINNINNPFRIDNGTEIFEESKTDDFNLFFTNEKNKSELEKSKKNPNIHSTPDPMLLKKETNIEKNSEYQPPKVTTVQIDDSQKFTETLDEIFKPSNDFFFLGAPTPNTNIIRIFMRPLDNAENKNSKKSECVKKTEFVNMEVKIHRDKNFLKSKDFKIKEAQFFENSAFVNICNKREFHRYYLYITGGNVSSYESNRFLQVDINNKITSAFPNMNEPRTEHGMILENNTVFVVGGKNNLTAEKYEFAKRKWTNLASLKDIAKLTELRNPNLTMINSYLYCFFGQNLNEISDKVFRLNTRISDSSWERVNYRNPDRIDLARVFCGIKKDKSNVRRIIFVGGMTSTKSATNSAFDYDCFSSTFKHIEISVDKYYFIKETNFVDFGDEKWGCFDTADFSSVLIMRK